MRARLLHAALAEDEEQHSWQCAWCLKMIEEGREGKKFCRACADYREDMMSGTFDDHPDKETSRG